MKNTINVLIIDAHPFVTEAYEQALKLIPFKNKPLNILKTQKSDEIDALLKNQETRIDLVLLDIDLPPSIDHKYLSGEDVAIALKERFKAVKIISFTFKTSNHKLYNILKNINPDGFLIKSDFTQKELINAIEQILSGIPYYSKTVTKLIRKHMSNQIMLDHVDREILYHLSTGVKMKDLPKKINLSLAGIERRKRNLKDLFNVEKRGDKYLVDIAKEKGFV